MNLLARLGEAYFEFEALEATLHIYEQALQITREQQDQRAVAHFLGRLSILNGELRDQNDALRLAQQRVEIANRLNNHQVLAEQLMI
jgi:hypothetical protein